MSEPEKKPPPPPPPQEPETPWWAGIAAWVYLRWRRLLGVKDSEE